MKNECLKILAVSLGLSAVIGSAQQPVPDLVCDDPVFNFGTKDNTTVVEHDFVLRNEGEGTLLIERAKPSCGCTVANISSKSVAPGETSVITAKLNLRNRTGRQQKVITVESNDPDQPRYVLTLAGEATALIDVQPRNIHASNLRPGQTVTNVITVTNNDDEPLEITAVDTGNPMIRAEVRTVEEGKRYEVVVTSGDELPKGPTFGRVTIRTSSPRLPLANVAYRYNVVGEISVYPQELAMIEQAKPMSKTLVVTPGTISEFEVTKVDVPSPDIGVNISPLGGGRYRIVLSNIVPDLSLNGQAIHVLTTAQNMESVEIPFKVIQRR